MKKLFSLVLALAMVLSLSGIAFADNSTALSQSTSSGDIAVQAKIVPMISADIAWGDMQFTYNEQSEVWNANDTNGVTVTNNTIGRSIDTSYSYARYDDKGETTMTAGWVEVEGTFSNPGAYTADAGYTTSFGSETTRALNALGTTLAPGAPQQFWLTFTTNDHVSDLTQEFAQVGTLIVGIAAH